MIKTLKLGEYNRNMSYDNDWDDYNEREIDDDPFPLEPWDERLDDNVRYKEEDDRDYDDDEYKRDDDDPVRDPAYDDMEDDFPNAF